MNILSLYNVSENDWNNLATDARGAYIWGIRIFLEEQTLLDIFETAAYRIFPIKKIFFKNFTYQQFRILISIIQKLLNLQALL